MRFPIRIGKFLRILLWPIGGPAGGSFVELGPARLRARFGGLFDHSFPLSQIASAERCEWPWYGGLGWRTDFHKAVGLIGEAQGVVKIRFSQPQRGRILLPVRFTELYVSLQEPDRFLEALQAARAGPGAAP
jgi:hypothetical protein